MKIQIPKTIYMDLEIKDLEIKAFINEKNFENMFRKHFLVVTRNLGKKSR